MWAKITIGALTLGILTGCQVKPQVEAVRLSKGELKALFVGKTVESYSLSSGTTSFSYYHPDGKVEQVRYWEKRDGRWKLTEDDQICLSMENKPFSCRAVFREGDRYYKYRPKDGGWRKILRYRQFLEGRHL